MPLGPGTRKWLVTILVAIAAVLLIVWIYTAWASEEVETEVTEPLGLAAATWTDPAPPPLRLPLP